MSADYVHPQNHERGLGCSRCKKTRFRKISRTKSRRQADHTVLGPLRRAGCSRFPSVCKAIPLRQKHEMQAFCNAHWAHGARLKSTISQKCCRPNPMHWFRTMKGVLGAHVAKNRNFEKISCKVREAVDLRLQNSAHRNRGPENGAP